MTNSPQHSHGFTLVQLIILLVLLAFLVASGIVIYTTIHNSSDAATNGQLTPITNHSQTTAEQNAAQSQRQCAALSPQQKAQLQQSRQPSMCATQ